MDAFIIFAAQYLYLLVAAAGALFFFLQPRRIQKQMIVCGIVIAPLAFILSRITGALYYDPRPFVIGHFIPLIAHVPDNGFPSDHALLTGAIAMVIWFFDRKRSVIFWMLALLIGWARVAAGIHHWTDIAGSIVIVLVSGAAYHFIVAKRYFRHSQ